MQVEGVVQGVGFRPFVHALAERLGLTGFVANDATGVVLEVQGSAAAVEALVAAVRRDAPPLAEIATVRSAPLPVEEGNEPGFLIRTSSTHGERRLGLPPDSAPCADCLIEQADPDERRHRHAFTNCTACGPRYTIVRDLPYDRPRTTMAPFALCARCRTEYTDHRDRRFHAQPVCCPDCGPSLALLAADGTPQPGDPLEGAVALLRRGGIVAVKGVGGYHLVCDAADEEAVARLRQRKLREERPFAVLVEDLAAARALCAVDDAEATLLAGQRCPIVLLERRPDAAIADGVAPANRSLGLLLPPTPLHRLLVEDVGGPLVLTSGNVASEPIAHRDDEALARLGPIADALLTHDREIAVRVDDSVVRLWRGTELLLRRARGYVPAPLLLSRPVPRPVLGCGAELKSTICLAAGAQAVVSQHLGDLEHWEAFRAFSETVDHLERLLDLRPEVVAHDLHPDYRSTRYAQELDDVTLVGVQHHHAHIAACLADNGVDGPVIGVALDGTGYGLDGTVWGGELLVGGLADVDRVGHLSTVPMPGGAAAIREPWRMASAWLDAAFDGAPAEHPVEQRNAERVEAVRSMAHSSINAPLTSSAGRLFDAVAALLGVRDVVTYEGQAAIELEQLADRAEPGGYEATVNAADMLLLPGEVLVRAVVADQRAGIAPGVIAMRFHRGLSAAVVSAVGVLHERTGLSTVALSGGVFQNVLLLELLVSGLEARGLTVLTHRRVPCNDGGISLGQAAVAGARDRR